MATEINYRLSSNYFETRKSSLEQLRSDTELLISLFSKKFIDFYSNEINDANADRISHHVKVFKEIKHCEGFNSHIKSYHKDNFSDHLFTAKVARYLISKGFSVVLEPKMESRCGGHPDIKASRNGNSFFAECKTSDVSRYYDSENKKLISDLIYDKIQTCDQLTFTFSKPLPASEFGKLITPQLIQNIYRCYKPGKDGFETKIAVNDYVTVLVTQKPTIIGKESEHVNGQLWMYLEDNESKNRDIGIVFFRGGRSIAVLETINYENKLRNKKEQSQHQIIENMPNIVFLRDSDLVGNPEIHREYIENEWLTENLNFCSGVVFFDTYRDVVINDETVQLTYYKNKHATFPIDL